MANLLYPKGCHCICEFSCDLLASDCFDFHLTSILWLDLTMKRIAFILLTNLLLVEGRKLSIWEDEKERKVDLDERERRMPQVRIAFSLSLLVNR